MATAYSMSILAEFSLEATWAGSCRAFCFSALSLLSSSWWHFWAGESLAVGLDAQRKDRCHLLSDLEPPWNVSPAAWSHTQRCSDRHACKNYQTSPKHRCYMTSYLPSLALPKDANESFDLHLQLMSFDNAKAFSCLKSLKTVLLQFTLLCTAHVGTSVLVRLQSGWLVWAGKHFPAESFLS